MFLFRNKNSLPAAFVLPKAFFVLRVSFVGLIWIYVEAIGFRRTRAGGPESRVNSWHAGSSTISPPPRPSCVQRVGKAHPFGQGGRAVCQALGVQVGKKTVPFYIVGVSSFNFPGGHLTLSQRLELLRVPRPLSQGSPTWCPWALWHLPAPPQLAVGDLIGFTD